MHDLDEFTWRGNIGPQKFWQSGPDIVMDCRSILDGGGVSVLTESHNRLTEYQERGYNCYVRLENITTGWVKEVAIDELPRKQAWMFYTGDEGFVVDVSDFADWDMEPI